MRMAPQATLVVRSACQSASVRACAEIVPALLAIIRQQQDGLVRAQLVHTLFNLVKKPNSEQRRVILDSYIELAVHLGPARTAAELLPQCWEQVG